MTNTRGNVKEDDDYMYSTMKNNTQFNNTFRNIGESNYAKMSSNLRKNSSSRSPRRIGRDIISARFVNPNTVGGSIAALD